MPPWLIYAPEMPTVSTRGAEGERAEREGLVCDLLVDQRCGQPLITKKTLCLDRGLVHPLLQLLLTFFSLAVAVH